MTSERPAWWRRNDEIRAEMGLPAYEPARLADGTYLHALVDELEAEHDCEIRVVSDDASYPSRWTIRVDGEDCASVRRRRDENRNNVYRITADAFRAAVADALT
ncbi:hypothetical protein EFA46_014100 (plasmid) [Halarchaeum sp. CBA1220]|uniref:hypothetical protein n=1 Tax=Halarchaeum sp. CBA1220 TaxID=1853682 RepID=UPI000F3A988B|nr:hypothetical protein [Halarchaeum sp. CBA1220]QLC35383.1 hypothetical protein EFA46_014100 [Halarchaeum sp. CBA1220]